MVLLRLQPNQISEHWEVIKEALLASAPPIMDGADDFVLYVLKQLISSKMQVWVMLNDNRTLIGIVITTVTRDDCSGTKSLLIYCVYGFRPVSSKAWEFGLNKLILFAKSNNCQKLSFYTQSDEILAVINRLGKFDTFTYGVMNVS